MRYVKILLFLSLLACSCDNTPEEIPYRKLRFNVPIAATRLNDVGGYEYFTGGISGVVIYRFDMYTFYAYDRACPHDWKEGGKVEMVNSIFLYDSLCGSMFNVLDGSPISGPAESPLRPYSTLLEDEFTLRVYN